MRKNTSGSIGGRFMGKDSSFIRSCLRKTCDATQNEKLERVRAYQDNLSKQNLSFHSSLDENPSTITDVLRNKINQFLFERALPQNETPETFNENEPPMASWQEFGLKIKEALSFTKKEKDSTEAKFDPEIHKLSAFNFDSYSRVGNELSNLCYEYLQTLRGEAFLSEYEYFKEKDIVGVLHLLSRRIFPENDLYTKMSPFLQKLFEAILEERLEIRNDPDIEGGLKISGEAEDVFIFLENGDFLGKNVTTLQMGPHLTDEYIERLIKIPKLNKIQNFIWVHNLLSEKGISKLFSSEIAKSIKMINLARNWMEDSGVKTLLQQKILRNITHLNLTFNGLEGNSLSKLFSAFVAPNLEKLVLRYNKFSKTTINALEKSIFPKLKIFDLRYCCIGDDGLINLSEARNLSELNELYLDGNEIGNDGVSALFSSEELFRLKRLSLRKNKITDEGLIIILSSKNLNEIEEIDLTENPIGGNILNFVLDNEERLKNCNFVIKLSKEYLGYEGLEFLMDLDISEKLFIFE